MAETMITVAVHLDIDLNGEPITRVLEAPAMLEEPGAGKGVTVHLHLDARKLAKALLPHLVAELPRVARTDHRAF